MKVLFWDISAVLILILKQVFVPAIAGHVAPWVVQAISSFLDFCYLVCRSSIDEDTLDEINHALAWFHAAWVVFEEADVRPTGFSLPHQHSLKHYRHMIQLFGVPNGLCSSITESKHIKAVKEPWHRSNWYDALGQILLSNQQADKLDAACADFITRGMLINPQPPENFLSLPTLPQTTFSCTDDDDFDDDAAHDGPWVSVEVILARSPGMLCR